MAIARTAPPPRKEKKLCPKGYLLSHLPISLDRKTKRPKREFNIVMSVARAVSHSSNVLVWPSETYCTCQNKTSHLLRKATDLCYAMVKKKYFLNPISRQNFAYAFAETVS